MKKMRERRLATALLVLVLVSGWWPTGALGQGSSAEVDVDSLLARMSPAEKVGQLFLVSFPGGVVVSDSDIVSLVRDYHIGGVLLRAGNGNFGQQGVDVNGLQAMVSQLQSVAISGEGTRSAASTPVSGTATATSGATKSVTETPAAVEETSVATETPTVSPTPVERTPEAAESPTGSAAPEGGTPESTELATAPPAGTALPTADEGTPAAPRLAAVPVPLFVAVAQSDLFWLSGESGMSPQMSLMGIGATWEATLSEKMGAVVGRELNALGINLLFGPALDLANPYRAGTPADLASESFGESPFWVGVLGRAYIRGVHAGGEGRVLTIATHLPGLGAVDRDVAHEIPVIQDSLASRLDTDLLPFLRVMAQKEGGQAGVADGMMVTHVQFRDVVGDVRMTKPVSLDPQAMAYLLGLSQALDWREAGGLIVSDSLGMASVKRFYDPQLVSFQAKRIAYEAFLAGSDVLCLDRFGLTDDWAEHFANVRAVLEYFQSKYASDTAFQSRVDESVRRILVAKQRMYPRFAAESVVGSEEAIAVVGQGLSDVADVAVRSVTLVYPKVGDLTNKIPALPSPDENLLVFEDVRRVSACTGCAEVALPEPGTVVSLLRTLYGGEGSGQIASDRVQGYLFADLWQYLESPAPASRNALQEGSVGDALAKANWVLFLTQGGDAEAPTDAGALRRLLLEQPEALGGKKVVVIACGAPYYLDATDMAKVSAFYAVYAPVEVAIEAGLRALFREFAPAGVSPVSIPGVGYKVENQLRPDSQQVLALQPVGVPGTGQSEALNIGLGDELVLQTREILDKNGHIVPDGTEVVFQFSYPESGVSWERREVTTDGRAQTRVLLDTAGTLMVSVSCGEAVLATTLMVTVLGDQPAVISTVPPPSPTVIAPEPTPGSVFAGDVQAPDPFGKSQSLDLGAFLLMTSGLMGLCAITWASGRQRGMGLLAAETALLAFAFGMMGYLAYGVVGLMLGRMPILAGAPWDAVSWRWQPAIAAWITSGAVGFCGVAWPRLALRMAQLGRRSEADGNQKRR